LLIEPEYSTPPLVDFADRRSQVTSVTEMSPLTELRSRPRTFTDFADTSPLTLPAARSPSVDTPDSVTLPDVLFAVSSSGVSGAMQLPLPVWAPPAPRTPVPLRLPEIEWTSSPAPAGIVMV